MVLTNSEKAKLAWKKRKEKYGNSGFSISKEERSRKISGGVSKAFKNGNVKLKEYYQKQKENPDENELNRREKISKAMEGRDITWFDKMSVSKIGKKNPMYGKIGKLHHNYGIELNHGKQVSDGIKEKISKEGYNWGMRGKKHSLESNRKNRESCIKYIEKFRLNGQPLKPRIGRNEKEILDKLETKFGHKILRQFKIAGYFIDGYIPEIKLAIEIDEEHHTQQKENDVVRQKEIEDLLDCKFIRIKD